jgi:hypothetical protein
LQGRQRQLHPRYAALASHYAFDPLFCMPARGNEKPDAEGAVKAVQRRFATPVPQVTDLAELNGLLLRRCEAERQRVVHALTGAFVIGERLTEDLAAATALPTHRFDPCVIRTDVAVDKYQTVAFDGYRYSVPRPFAFEMVRVKGYVETVEIVARGRVVASHRRGTGPPTMVLEPRHYLAVLGQKPGALDHAPVFRDWKLPACFGAFRAELEGRHGVPAGSRQFVRVLQLLGEHPMTRVRKAIEECQHNHVINADAVIQRTRSLGAIEAATRAGSPPPAEGPPGPQVHVPRPDLGRFDQLLSAPAAVGPVTVFFT